LRKTTKKANNEGSAAKTFVATWLRPLDRWVGPQAAGTKQDVTAYANPWLTPHHQWKGAILARGWQKVELIYG